jgi:pimeloyl-ACP methyl ester carboxylesterase
MTTQRTRSAFAIAALVACGTHLALAQQSPVADRYVGTWMGTLATPAAKVRLALMVKRDPNGGLSGEMVSVDQGNATIAATVSLHGDTIVVAIPSAQASYTGVLGAANDSIRGSFTQGASLPLNMGRAALLPAAARPQEPKPPFPYDARDMTFESVPGVRLAGTIVTPPGPGPFPALVMVTGSGPQNRNEELLGHKPFLVISDYLARHGIATLRYDDRGTAQSTGSFSAGTSVDFANDAEAAVRFMRAQAKIDRNHVGIIGHSEGGMIAPMVAVRSRDVAFIVLLAGPGIPGDSILLLQEQLIATAMGTPPAMVERNTEANRRLFAAIKSATDSADAVARVMATEQKMLATLPENERATAEQQLGAARGQLLTPWMRYFLSYDPRPTLRKVHVPVLALDGTLDLQVPYKQDLAAIDTALKAGGNRDYRIVELPGLNHLFQTATTGNPAEYATIAETFSPAALEIIATWINAHAGTTR